jgi:hypothetical protein
MAVYPVRTLSALCDALVTLWRRARRWLAVAACCLAGIALAGCGVVLADEASYAAGSAGLGCAQPGLVMFTGASTNDPPGTPDPGKGQDVATCSTQVVGGTLVRVFIRNGYPGYTCTFGTTVRNTGTLPACLDRLDYVVSPALSLDGREGLAGFVLRPGRSVVHTYSVSLGHEVVPGATYMFSVTAHFRALMPGSAPCAR